MHNLNQKGRSRKRTVLFPAFRSIHSSVIETLFEILALRWLSRSDLLFVPRVALVPRGAWSFVSFQRVALEISAGSRRCCVMSLGKPTRYRRLSFFVESGRCWAACWSCNYGFEELLSMVTSACDVKAVTSSTRWSRSSRASWRAIEEARRKRVIFKLVSSFKQPDISTPPAAKPIRWSLWGGASPRTLSVAMLTLSDI